MGNVIINPEYVKLIEEIKQLKEDIASLYEEKDELIYHTCKNIEIKYAKNDVDIFDKVTYCNKESRIYGRIKQRWTSFTKKSND